MNELKELYYYYSDCSNAINMTNILENLKELYVKDYLWNNSIVHL